MKYIIFLASLILNIGVAHASDNLHEGWVCGNIAKNYALTAEEYMQQIKNASAVSSKKSPTEHVANFTRVQKKIISLLESQKQNRCDTHTLLFHRLKTMPKSWQSSHKQRYFNSNGSVDKKGLCKSIYSAKRQAKALAGFFYNWADVQINAKNIDAIATDAISKGLNIKKQVREFSLRSKEQKMALVEIYNMVFILQNLRLKVFGCYSHST